MQRTNKKSSYKEQVKSLDIKDNMEENSIYYGDDRNISTQIITLSNYRPNGD